MIIILESISTVRPKDYPYFDLVMKLRFFIFIFLHFFPDPLPGTQILVVEIENNLCPSSSLVKLSLGPCLMDQKCLQSIKI